MKCSRPWLTSYWVKEVTGSSLSPSVRLSGPSTTLSPTTTFMLGALLLRSGGWSLTGVTVMLNVSVTSRLSVARR
ncbi:hypothetical protein EYF80_003403 [Liparis tanakae]|uniref:Uncharacterized protein n=1 Tax=Liparis tanakae TaxID=230148 RepID=A0A4Z2J9G4_9TELE|nr:hypothetical protein EYF80_003403 [Liparis tanakae]